MNSRRHIVHAPETPKNDWELTGELHRTVNGAKPVYRERIKNLKKVQVVDENGVPQYQKHPTTGMNVRPMTELVQDEKEPFIEREFVLENPGTGMVWKNYNFRDNTPPKPEEIDTDALLARIAALEAKAGGAVEETPKVDLPDLEWATDEE